MGSSERKIMVKKYQTVKYVNYFSYIVGLFN